MTRTEHFVLDEATVALLRATTPTDVHAALDRDPRPAYLRPGRLRWGDRVCAMLGCTGRVPPGRRMYCSHRCMNRAVYRRWWARHHRSWITTRRRIAVETVRRRVA